MTTFKMGKAVVVCDSKSERGGFRHRAVLTVGGHQVDKAFCHYVNRTWEAYEYQTVLHKVIEKTTRLNKAQKTRFKSKCSRKGW